MVPLPAVRDGAATPGPPVIGDIRRGASRPGASAQALVPAATVIRGRTDHRVEVAGRLQPGRLLLPVAGAGSSADQLPEHSVAPAVLVDGALAALGVYEPPTAGKNPAMSHIIGRPNDDLLDVMLGHDADPEQTFIGGSEHGLEEGYGFEARRPDDEPTVSES